MHMKLYKWIGWAAPALLTALFSASCGREPVLDIDSHDAGQALMIAPVLEDMQGTELRTRAILTNELKDNRYNENVVNRLDVFFFKSADDSFVKAYHIVTAGMQQETHGEKTGFLLTDDWSKHLALNTAYDVYIVANSTNETITTAETVTLASLKGCMLEDANIYQRYRQTADEKGTYSTTKAFLMNAKTSWTIRSNGTQQVGDSAIKLTRAAVKFLVSIKLSDTFAQRIREKGERYGQPSWKFINFNTVTAEVTDATAPEEKLVTRGSGAYLAFERTTAGTATADTVVTYAYPQSWSDAAIASDKAPALLISYPCDHGDGTAEAIHYYYIPLCPSSTTSTLANNLYKVDAVISSYGSYEAVTNNDVLLNYEVLPWGDPSEADIKATANDYLLASPTTYVFKGGPVGEFLSTKIKYYASGTVTIKDGSITAFYNDKNGDPQPVDASQYSIGTPANGEILIQSKVPTNGTMQQVEFTVKCGDKEQVVKFRHYPLDFITAEDGSYSTYLSTYPSNDKPTGWVTLGNSSTYSGSYYNDGHFCFLANEYNIFHAHTFYNGRVYNLNYDGQRGSVIEHLTNNQMYILQITSANDEYTVGKPRLAINSENVCSLQQSWWGGYEYPTLGTIDYCTSEDDVISPAFMLGSQLGAVLPVSDSKYAAMHCALYLEHSAGKDWTGWRLPTKQELQFMIDNQNTYPDAMIEVLSGEYYWTLDGGYGQYSGGSGGEATGSKYVRCVRDMSKEELDEINKFE